MRMIERVISRHWRPMLLVLGSAGAAFAIACADLPTAPRANAASLDATSALDARGRAAFAALRDDSVFASAYVGFGAARSTDARRLRIILAEPGAAAVFEQLWREGSPAGRLYALVGLALADSAAFAAHAPVAAADGTELQTMFGCIVSTMTVSEAFRNIADWGEISEYALTPSSAREDAISDSLDARFEREWRAKHGN